MGLKKVLGNIGRRFKGKESNDTDNTSNDNAPEDTQNVEKEASDQAPKKKGRKLPKFKNPLPGLASGAADVAGKTLKGVQDLGRVTADNMAKGAGEVSEKSGLRDAMNKASAKASEVSKKASEAVKKPLDKAAKEIREHAEAKKDHPTSGSTAVDLLFPTGGQRPGDDKPKPKAPPKP